MIEGKWELADSIHEGRHEFIGASEVGALMGVDPFRTRDDIIRSKVGGASATDDLRGPSGVIPQKNHKKLLGNMLEEQIAKAMQIINPKWKLLNYYGKMKKSGDFRTRN